MLKLRRDKKLTDRLETIVRYFIVKFYKYLRVKKTFKIREFNGINIRAHPGCAISEKLFVVGLYDYDGMKFLTDYVKNGDVFFDIGSNIGPYSLIISKKTKNVYAFEGHPTTTERLQENFKLNDLEVFQAINLAISNEQGEVTFKNVCGSSINKISNSKKGSITVDSNTVDNLSKSYGIPRFVKIDTEGHELNVIKGMRKIIETEKVDFISFEANGILKKNELKEIHNLLTKNNYQIGILEYDRKIFRHSNDLGHKSPTGEYRALSKSLRDKILSDGYSIKELN